MRKTLFFGTLEWGSTSLQRFRAMSELLEDVHGLDNRIVMSEYVGRSRLERIKARTGWPPLVRSTGEALVQEVTRYRPDVVWVDQGIAVADDALTRIREALPGCMLVHYTADSIVSPGFSGRLFRKALPVYDYCITTKQRELNLYRSLGASNVIFSWQGYDHTIHRPVALSAAEKDLYTSDVAFVGQYMPRRAGYLAALALRGDLKLNLFGRGWKNGPTGSVLSRFDRGWLYGDSYAKALAGARMALCFLNDSVGDDYTTRTFEIPACGSMMLAERTEAHRSLFIEEEEAAYFETVEEFLDKVEHFHRHESERARIATAGHARVLASGCSWRDRIGQCFEELQAA